MVTAQVLLTFQAQLKYERVHEDFLVLTWKKIFRVLCFIISSLVAPIIIVLK